jgi:hypothetical protein
MQKPYKIKYKLIFYLTCLSIKVGFVVFVFLQFSYGVKAQMPDLYIVNIKAIVTSALNDEPIPYAHVINHRVRGGTTTNAEGFFSINMLTEDTLVLKAIGYTDYYFTISEYPPKPLYTIVMRPVRYLLDEVTVTESNKLREKLGIPDAKPLDIPIELRGDAFNEKPSLLAAIISPVSFLHYHLSDKEKNKRNTLSAIKSGKEWYQFSTYHNLENIKRITKLDGDEADLFMIYCNVNNKLPYFASQMEIEFQIMDLFFKYKREREEGKKEDDE